ncbi:MAG TPA: FTR1 family protein [Rhizomicrobium sp.]|nr:FTR1 family protein [Rhizomicrobium sp.]
MLATAIVVFREIIEAGLVIGIVLAATRGVPKRTLWVIYGVAAGVAGAGLVALFTDSLNSALGGVGQEMFDVAILSAAVVMLTWHNVWMARNGRDIAVEMGKVGEAVAAGQRSLAALAIVVGIAVLREGSEIVLFLYGIAISGGLSLATMMLGGALGLAAGAGVAALMYFGLIRVPTRHLFGVTSWLIALLAAGMAAQAVAFLQQAQIITVLSKAVWNTSRFLDDGSVAGRVLHTLIGYTARPSAMQLAVYGATLFTMFLLMRLFSRAPTRPS